MTRSDVEDLLAALEDHAEEDEPTLAHLQRWRRIVETYRDEPDRLVDLLASVYAAGVRLGLARAREDEDSRWLSRQGVVR
jgi:hypothetical protein